MRVQNSREAYTVGRRSFKALMSIIVYPYEEGLLYVKGVFKEKLGPGRHSTLFGRTVAKVDMRLRQAVMGSQEILTRDHISLRCSVVVGFKVADSVKVTHAAKDPDTQLYVAGQLALRAAVGARDFEEVLSDKGAIGEEIVAGLAEAAGALGFAVVSADVRDVALPGALKKAYAEAQTARQEGLASLERARAESAALRSLANSAKILVNNPELLALRTLQAVEHGSGNVLLLNSLLNPGKNSAEALDDLA